MVLLRKHHMPEYFSLALIGHPLSHSLSPVLHNAALKSAGLDGNYQLIDIEPKDFYGHFAQSLPKNLIGFNVTIPYKEDMYKLMSNKSFEAKLVGAINTVKIEKDGIFSGHNTDLLGFKESFKSSFNIDLKDKHAFVIGAGGSAKAIVIGLAQMGIAKIRIKARDVIKGNSFIEEIKANLAQFQENELTIPEIVSADSKDTSTIDEPIAAMINTSPLGLHGETAPKWLNEILDILPNTCICFDLVYRKDKSKPTVTQAAIAKNLPAIDGLSMLIHQARSSFEYWTGVDVPTKVFFESLGLKTQESKLP